MHNTAVGKTGQCGNCRSLKSTFGNGVPLTCLKLNICEMFLKAFGSSSNYELINFGQRY